MSVVLLPFRAIYRGLVWLANSPRTLILSYLLLIVVSGVLYRIFEERQRRRRRLVGGGHRVHRRLRRHLAGDLAGPRRSRPS